MPPKYFSQQLLGNYANLSLSIFICHKYELVIGYNKNKTRQTKSKLKKQQLFQKVI